MRPTKQLCITFFLIFAIAGCAGSGYVSIVSTNLRKLPAHGPLVETVEARRCFYWMDDPQQSGSSSSTQRLYIAMESEDLSNFLSKSKKKMMMSLVLPYGSNHIERTYPVNRQSFRMIRHHGYSHSRWASLSGLVSIKREDDGSISGRFKIAARQQSFLITTGWAGEQRALLAGEFRAVHNPKNGKRIIEATEEYGMSRASPKRSITPPAASETRDEEL